MQPRCERRCAAPLTAARTYRIHPNDPARAEAAAASDERRASLAKVICTLKTAVEKLQLAQGAQAVNERRKTTEQLTLQVRRSPLPSMLDQAWLAH
jgi:hypothetical protein